MLRIPITALFIFICGIVSFCYSQDSVKKSPEQSITKHYKHHTNNVDSAAIKQGVQQTTPAKPDSNAPATTTDKSLKGQYVYLLTKLYHYQQPFAYAFWKNASDTIKLYRQIQKAANGKITLQNKVIDSLKSEITGKDEALSAKVEEVNLVGIQKSLLVYNLIVWGLVIAFALTALIVISSSASFRNEAKYRTNLYGELEDEFKAFKSKANEREKKLARELQTERNKLDELLGRDNSNPL